jgi:hypothetical protein
MYYKNYSGIQKIPSKEVGRNNEFLVSRALLRARTMLSRRKCGVNLADHSTTGYFICIYQYTCYTNFDFQQSESHERLRNGSWLNGT